MDKKNQRFLKQKYKGTSKRRPLIFYIYEEARNLFSNKIFNELDIFERVIHEWRSDDLVFMPITQEPHHIPDKVLNGFEIKLILTAGDDEEEKENLVENLSKRLALGEKRKKLIEELPKFTAAILYSDGYFTIKFPTTKKMLECFDTGDDD